MAQNSDINWDLLARRIRSGKLTPIIGDRVGHKGFLTNTPLVREWAASIDYPMPATTNITRVAQFRSITVDPLAAKEDFLDFLKRRLLAQARERNTLTADFLDNLEDELERLPFSTVAGRLNYPDFEADPLNPLAVLAQLSLPLYITTSFHPFMANAFARTASAKTPRIERCPWFEPTLARTSLLDEDGYVDDTQQPVVYHLYGIDTEVESLVFTEDDYLDFLVRASEDNHVIPVRIGEALAGSSLLLLGYEVQDWDFRVLFRGLIRKKHTARRPRSVCIQLDPQEQEGADPQEIEHYLSTYFGEYKFDVYWGSANEFARELWENVGSA